MKIEHTLPITEHQAVERVEQLLEELERPLKVINLKIAVEPWEPTDGGQRRTFTITKGVATLKGCLCLIPHPGGLTIQLEATGFLVSLFRSNIIDGFDAIIGGGLKPK